MMAAATGHQCSPGPAAGSRPVVGSGAGLCSVVILDDELAARQRNHPGWMMSGREPSDLAKIALGVRTSAAVHIAVTSPNYVCNWVAAFSREDRRRKNAHVIVENPDRDVGRSEKSGAAHRSARRAARLFTADVPS